MSKPGAGCVAGPALASLEASSTLEDTLAKWQRVTRAANQAFADRDLDVALAGYRAALRAVVRLIDDTVLAQRPDDCLAAWVVSHHNLADCQSRLGRNAEAAECLCLAHRRLLRIAGDTATTARMRDAALRHMRETHLALLLWLHRNGRHVAVESVLGETAALLAHDGPPFIPSPPRH